MVEDTSEILREIAALLRQRNEQAVEMSKLATERMARTGTRMPPRVPDYEALSAKHDEERNRRYEETARQRTEDLEFRERLLAAIERQNELIAKLLAGTK